MTDQRTQPELSIIVPTLDERGTIAELLAMIARQQEVDFEVIISDGGSTDGTADWAAEIASQYRIPLKLVAGGKGRGAQLNEGVAASSGSYLLFLHADSSFEDRFALRKGVDTVAHCQDKAIAAKFALRFAKGAASPSLGYYYYETKGRLLRPECSHGDQGLIMSRDCFALLGPCEVFPAMLAETRLADKIRHNGRLLLIPAEIFTSARRFESEGLPQRQTVNAILLNCANQGWDAPFLAIAELYRSQSCTGKLQLYPLFASIRKLISSLPPHERYRFWKDTGSYVRYNAWQIAFFLDVRRNFKKGGPPSQGSTPILDRYDRFIAPILDNQFFNLLATVLTWAWFNLTRLQSLVFRS
ncbi:glycosyltransferase [Geobacter pelophilus]|uniref:Glycosyltransferase n=1 Tax=Geoanaerobacter pelophilus TaxID=60036 RepID=A0AAW4KY60_9BACT|nr:glycosyltransferase [Geoanaerobacter pelophilus]MBT0663493.1 glycosyltransferase [Geoanaerobacter pelophilus]